MCRAETALLLTFQSLFCGWRGTRGRSLLPGRMCSGGVQSICSSSLPFFFRLPLSGVTWKQARWKSAVHLHAATLTHLTAHWTWLTLKVSYMPSYLRGRHQWRCWGRRGSCSPLHCRRLRGPGFSAGLWCDAHGCGPRVLCRALKETQRVQTAGSE